MKNLIIARHGEYIPRGGLTPRGRKQLQSLGEKLKRFGLAETKPRILTSIALRAKESADILVGILEGEITEHDVLWSDVGRRTQITEVLDLIDHNSDCDVVVIVTHFEYAEELPPAIGQKYFDTRFYREELQKGQAWWIKFDDGSITRIET